MASTSGQTFTIHGVKVQFPHKPYPSQFSMMDKIIKGIEKGQNCLLESPTGSGKSLALLCSALAWQRAERDKIYAEEKADEKAKANCKCCMEETSDTAAPPECDVMITSVNQNPPPPPDPGVCPDIEDDDFKIESRTFRTPQGGRITTNAVSTTGSTKDQTSPSTSSFTKPEEKTSWKMEVSKKSCTCSSESPRTTRKVPKIWFGTRTHKQIAQIARELGKTEYKHVRMCILSSREHTCIHPIVSKSKTKNEDCKRILEDSRCKFNENIKKRKLSHRTLQEGSLSEAWDLEEFVSFCKGVKACPYFGSRLLKDSAEIIFCPYNYLIDPIIRESMEINLKEQIVILDEAHNIEDSAREAASFHCHAQQLLDAQTEMFKLTNHKAEMGERGDTEYAAGIDESRVLRDMLAGLHVLVTDSEKLVKSHSYDQGSKVWTGVEMVARLHKSNIHEQSMEALRKAYQKMEAEQADPESKQDHRFFKLHTSTLKLIEGLMMVLSFIFRDKMRYMHDYRLALLQTTVYTAPQNTDDVWLHKSTNRRRGGNRVPTVLNALHFWCLNPAVAFREMGENVRSIILTSGTLSPMNTFQSELGTDFPIQLEASHVVGKSQVWVGSIAKGPRGCGLLGNYQTSETFAYQDDVGELLLGVCETIQHGVLCFLPSYKSLEKLTRRWKNTGLYEKIQQKKHIMSEPKASDHVDFDELLRSFYEAIESCEDGGDEQGRTGALFLAVCRGKVSEGMDFSDNNARAVLTIGVPFPNVKDAQVEAKKEYNNRHAHERGLLTGSEWYEIQAFRALNQALGRCIRHRNDWGALILVDERFAKYQQRYSKGLSKWVRQRVQHHRTFVEARQSLRFFAEERQKQPVTHDVSMMNQSALVQSPFNTTSVHPTFKTPLRETPSTSTMHPGLNPSVQNAAQQSASPYFVRKQNAKQNADEKFGGDGGGFFTATQEEQITADIQREHAGKYEPQEMAVDKADDQLDKQEGFIDFCEDDFQPSNSSTQLPGKATRGRKSQAKTSSKKGLKKANTTLEEFELGSSQMENFTLNSSQMVKGTLDFSSPIPESKPSTSSKKLPLKDKLNRFSYPPCDGKEFVNETQSKAKRKSLDPSYVMKVEEKGSAICDTDKVTANSILTVNEAKQNSITADFNYTNKPAKSNDLEPTYNREMSRSPDLFDSDTELPQTMSCDSELENVIRNVNTETRANKESSKEIKSSLIDALIKTEPTLGNRKIKTENNVVLSNKKRETRKLIHEKIELDPASQPDDFKTVNTENRTNAATNQIQEAPKEPILRRSRRTPNKKDKSCQEKGDQLRQDKSAVENGYTKTVDTSNTNDENQEDLKTRRGKRRRPFANLPTRKKSRSAKGVDFEDEGDNLKVPHIVSCRKCKKQLLNNITDKARPEKSAVPPFIQSRCGEESPVLITDLSNNTTKLNRIQLNINSGYPVTSYISESEGCCYRYLCCKCGPLVIGVEVKLLGETHHKSLKLNQVWLFPQAVMVAPSNETNTN